MEDINEYYVLDKNKKLIKIFHSQKECTDWCKNNARSLGPFYISSQIVLHTLEYVSENGKISKLYSEVPQ